MEYFAHSSVSGGPPPSGWHKLSDHLRAVAGLAGKFAGEIDATLRPAARAAGFLHDLGKYQQQFQQRLTGSHNRRVVHALQGASHAAIAGGADVALAVAGHHAGIPNAAGLKNRCRDYTPDAIWQDAVRDLTELQQLTVPPAPGELRKHPLRADVRIRLLFSCLVDADFLDTESHFDPQRSSFRDAAPLDAQRKRATLLEAIQRKAAECTEGPVKTARGEVLPTSRRPASDDSTHRFRIGS